MQGSVDLDVRYAKKEAEKFLDGIAPVIRPYVDNDAIHLMQHTDFAKTDEFMDLPDDQQQIWVQHIVTHVQNIVARTQALQAAGMNPSDPQFTEQRMGLTEAQIAAQMAAGQNGGVPNGAEGPDPRLTPQGAKIPPQEPPPPPDLAAAGEGTPQMPPGIQQPRQLGAP